MSYFFFFKQKTAYEMRISDWSSDVCSSDLVPDDPGEAVLCIAGGEIAVNLAHRERQFFGCRNIGGHADEGGARAVHPEAFAIGGGRPAHRRDFLKFFDDFAGITAIYVRKGIAARRAAVRFDRMEKQHVLPQAFEPSRPFLP